MPEEKSKKRDVNTEWIPFFKDSNNTYINDLAKRAKRSSTHASILSSKLSYILGDGIQIIRKDLEPYEDGDNPKLEEYLNSINSYDESIEEVFSRLAYDFLYSGNGYLQVIREKDRINIFHQDSSQVRLGKAVDNKIDKAFISSDWTEIKNNKPLSDQNVIPIDVFNKNSKSQKKSIIHIKEYSPEHFYYGLPEYVSAIKWIDIEYKIPSFNLTLFENGLLPSGVLTLRGDVPEGYKSPVDYVNDIKDKFTGEDNTSKFLVQLVDNDVNDASFDPFTNINEGHFRLLQELAVQNIISAHKWHPSLSGIQTAGKLGTNQEIRSAYEIVLNTTIRHYQKKLLKPLNTILELAGFGEYELTINNSYPVSFGSEISANEVLTLDEKRQELGYEIATEEQKQELNGSKTNNPAGGSEDSIA